MNISIKQNEITRGRLLEHYRRYSRLELEDVLKFLFQSSFGCEHLLADRDAALGYIKQEYAGVDKSLPPLVEQLDGDYSRVHLSWLGAGLSAETLTSLFVLSAKKEPHGREALEEKLAVARELILEGKLTLDIGHFDATVAKWRELGYPAIRHSEAFRASYRPAYRVVESRFAKILPILSRIDTLLARGEQNIALDGVTEEQRSALEPILAQIYGDSTDIRLI